MSSLVFSARSNPAQELKSGVALPSWGAGKDSRLIDDRLKSMKELLSGAASALARTNDIDIKGLALGDQLAAKIASFKRMTAAVAMHLDAGWRVTLLRTLESLLDSNDWDADFRLPSEQSFSTFLRMIIYLHPTKRPGIGLSPNGHFLAAWSRDSDRIVIECVGNDEVRWVISRVVDSERESGAGKVLLHRVPDVTAPYDPEPLFSDAHKVLA